MELHSTDAWLSVYATMDVNGKHGLHRMETGEPTGEPFERPKASRAKATSWLGGTLASVILFRFLAEGHSRVWTDWRSPFYFELFPVALFLYGLGTGPFLAKLRGKKLAFACLMSGIAGCLLSMLVAFLGLWISDRQILGNSDWSRVGYVFLFYAVFSSRPLPNWLFPLVQLVATLLLESARKLAHDAIILREP